MGQKNTFFEKQTGEVVEKKEKWPKNKPEQTGKQSGEVIENTCLWKKRTGTNLKTKLPILLKTLESQKKRTGVPRAEFPARSSPATAGSPACPRFGSALAHETSPESTQPWVRTGA
ncbi:MAG TPA: hypothetical protein VFQ24_09305 [Terriglobia bacterium]|nr:hypothetical protein [Terriglobia bacterium]